MPKVTRGNQNQGNHRSTPLTVVSNNGVQTRHSRIISQSNNQIQDLSQDQNQTSDSMPQLPSSHQHQHSHSHSHSHQAYYNTAAMQQQAQQYAVSQQGYPNGGPVQQPIQYQTIQPQTQQPQATHSLRASSGAWTAADDQTLMAARAQGMGWAPIQSTYFPTKTGNACRKRHERLLEKRNADDWDGLKLEKLARHYMSMRKEIWGGLAAETGEKWNVVEAKCMGYGLKNLGAAARSGSRREKVNDLSRNGGRFEDDSGLGMEEEEGFSDVSNGNGFAAYANAGLMTQHQQQQAAYDAHGRSAQQQQQQYQQRLASMDMGIGSIINRPN